MNIQIGPKAAEIAKQKGKNYKDLAKAINTGERNIFRVLEKDDLPASTIWKLSEALEVNLFELFHPNVAKSNDFMMNEVQEKYHSEKHLRFNLQVEYPLSLSGEMGNFVLHVHALATKMGFKLV